MDAKSTDITIIYFVCAGENFVSALQSVTASLVKLLPKSSVSVLCPIFDSHSDDFPPKSKHNLIHDIRWCRNSTFLIAAGSNLYRVNNSTKTSENMDNVQMTTASPNYNKITFDAQIVTFSFSADADKGVVSTVSGTVWFVEWSTGSLVRLTSSHASGEYLIMPGILFPNVTSYGRLTLFVYFSRYADTSEFACNFMETRIGLLCRWTRW